MPGYDKLLDMLQTHADAFAIAALLAAAIGAVYLVVARLLRVYGNRGVLPVPLVRTLRRTFRWAAIIIVVLVTLQVFGVLGSALTALTGILALVAIGFVAVWSVLSNTLCSLIILVTQPFRVGDRIRFPPDPIEGKVVNFNLVFTTLQTDDGGHIQVPNNLFFQRITIRVNQNSQPIALGDQLYRREDAEV